LYTCICQRGRILPDGVLKTENLDVGIERGSYISFCGEQVSSGRISLIKNAPRSNVL